MLEKWFGAEANKVSGWPFARTRKWTFLLALGVFIIGIFGFLTSMEWLFLIVPWLLLVAIADRWARQRSK